MKTLVFFLEEPSAKEMLKGVLPRILPEGISVRYIVFSGKRDLYKHLKHKLRHWRLPGCRFVVMCDQDQEDCKGVKTKLKLLCREAGKNDVLIRIACHELESFYLGDLSAVEIGLGIRGLGAKQERRKFRNPDAVCSPADELLRLTGNMYGKVSGSRAIAPYLHLNSNRSGSFNRLLTGIKTLLKN